MATIKVRVQGEIATNLTPEVRLVCQNDKYNVEFEFDESWANSNFKTALFIYNGKSIAVPFDREQNGNVCKIPALYETELLHIGVKSNDVDGLHTSTPARVGCLLSANDIANGEIPNPTPSQYDEIIALLNMYITGGGSGEGVDLRDYQKKVDNALETTDKTIVGAINEVNDKVGQGGSGSAEVEFGETKGTAYEGHKGKQNADNIAGLQEIVNSFNADLADLTGKVDLMQPKSDETLPTKSKEIVGAIKELYEREDKQGLTEEEVREIVQETAVTQESDPTVPDWAKQEEKPTYTYEEIADKPDLVEDIGSSLAEETNVLTIELKDKSGKVIATTQVTIPKSETPDLSAYVKNEDRDSFVQQGIVNNSLQNTDEEKASACEWLGALKAYTEKSGLPWVYAKNNNGTQTTFNLVSEWDDASSGVPKYFLDRDENGKLVYMQLSVNPIPTRRDSATSKEYVDGKIADLLARIEALGK